MAQEVRLQGRTYSDVPSVRLPDSNGVFHPFTDVSDTTATASDVASGKYFYLADGTKTQGTSSGGGGGGVIYQDRQGYLVVEDQGGGQSVIVESLSVTSNGTYTAPAGRAYSPVTVNVSGGGGGGGFVYEEGEWIPTVDTSDATIPFTNTHLEPPFFYAIADAEGTEASTTADNEVVTYFNNAQYFGTGAVISSTFTVYGLACSRYKSGANGTGGTSFYLSTPHTDSSDTSTTQSRFWAKATGIRFYTNSSTRYARANRSYKWIAIWKPST